MRSKWETSAEQVEIEYTDRGMVLNLLLDEEPEVSESGWIAINIQAVAREFCAQQSEAAQAIIEAARQLPEFFEAGGRTHSFVPLLDALDERRAPCT